MHGPSTLGILHYMLIWYKENPNGDIVWQREAGWETANAERKVEILNQMNKSMIPFEVIGVIGEILDKNNNFLKGLGWASTAIDITTSFKANQINYQNGMIDKDRYQFRNIGITTSVGVGVSLGRYHPAAGLIGGTGTSYLFDGIEAAADYLNNGAHQIKNQIIHSIKFQYR